MITDMYRERITGSSLSVLDNLQDMCCEHKSLYNSYPDICENDIPDPKKTCLEKY